ncbi:MAG: glycosyl hydrolase [Bacteroidota bacterium]
MKRAFIFSFIVAALAWSCEERFSDGEFAYSDIENNDTLLIPGAGTIGKKGIALRQSGSDWSAKVSSVKAHWHYSGTGKVSFKEPGNIDFVPMIEDSSALRKDDVEALWKMKNSGTLRYLIGFDRPDEITGADMTVSGAVALWPSLEQFEVPLGSPLCSDAEGAWMEDFMAQAGSQGLRVDYVSVQWMEGKDPEVFLSKLESIHQKYGLPIWVTSFTMSEARLSEVMPFMERVLPELESREYIFRYAWFSGEVNTPTALWDAFGGLTSRGAYYAGFHANDYISMGRDHWIDFASLVNLVVNPGFETGDLTAWDGYGIMIESEDVFSGDYAGRATITGWKSGSALNYTIPVESGGTFYISFAAKLTEEITGPEGFEGVAAVVTNGHDKQLQYFWFDPVSSTEWVTMTEQVEVPDTITSIRLAWWRARNSPELLLDDFFLAKID